MSLIYDIIIIDIKSTSFPHHMKQNYQTTPNIVSTRERYITEETSSVISGHYPIFVY